jgi:hypothetical protein
VAMDTHNDVSAGDNDGGQLSVVSCPRFEPATEVGREGGVLSIVGAR